MRTEQDFLHELWCRAARKEYAAPKKVPSLAELSLTEWSSEFERLMRNRLIMGAMRYGTFAEHAAAGGSPHDNCSSIIKHVKLYQEGGNTEHLVDCANLSLKEFLIGVHPLKHFCATDDPDHHTQRRKP